MQILDNVFNPSTVNIILDIETTGTKPGCRVLSIGLAYFDRKGVIASTYIMPAIEQQVGFDEPGTLEWWKKQTAEARNVFADNIADGISVSDAAEVMQEFIDDCIKSHVSEFKDEDKPRVHIWGNGATFDNAILAKMFSDNNVNVPWNTFGDRCYRTITSTLNKVVPPCDRGIPHNAVDDAINQVNILLATLHNARE